MTADEFMTMSDEQVHERVQSAQNAAMTDTTKPTVAEVKETLAQVIAVKPHADAYAASIVAFAELYGRPYTGKDRPALERIRWHAKRMLAGQSGQWGGVRRGQGYRKPMPQEVTE